LSARGLVSNGWPSSPPFASGSPLAARPSTPLRSRSLILARPTSSGSGFAAAPIALRAQTARAGPNRAHVMQLPPYCRLPSPTAGTPRSGATGPNPKKKRPAAIARALNARVSQRFTHRTQGRSAGL
jgi:hypothetical protein